MAISMAGLRSFVWSGGEAVAVGAGRDAEAAGERAAQGLDGPEPAAAGDGVDRHGAALEREPRALDAQRPDIGGPGHARLRLERARGGGLAPRPPGAEGGGG